MPRLLRRAAVLGTTAHIASRRGQARGAAAAEQQAEAAPPYAPQPEPAPAYVPQPAPATPPAASTEDVYTQLMKLKELLDAGVLTQAEFDAQKQKVLSA